MNRDPTGELWSQVRSLQNDVTMIRTRQDIAIERIKEYVEMAHDDKEHADEAIAETQRLLQEILATQKAYNQIISRLLPFAVVVFSVLFSAWAVGYLG